MPPAHPSRHAFALRLAALTALALVGRVVFALVAGYEAEGTLSDSLNYHLLGENLAEGRGYIRAFDWAISGVRVPTAEFPPVLPLVIAGLHLLGIDTVQGQEVALAAVGAATVALVGLLAREIAGDRVGLVAAALAAAYPMLVLPDATLQAEGVYGLLVAAVLLLTVRWRASRSPRDWLAVGGLVGLATLTRSEAFLLVPLVVAPLTLRRGMRDALRPVALAGLGLLAVVAPWTVRNAVELDHLIPLSNNRGT
ncbi:MAG: glycosyltransferase family 39 protein, partial [Acidimicrobiia bacterium]